MKRAVQPELLDELPFDHPDALHNRRDIRLFNRLMGNFRWFARELRRHPGALDGPLLEIGAGAGDLGLHLAARGVVSPAAAGYDGLDLCPRPGAWPEGWGWHRADLLEFDGYGGFPTVLANFILHQFEAEALGRVGAAIDRGGARLVLASELARRPLHLHQLKLGPLLGINHVTRHDARVSVEAGFVGDELPRMLGLPEQRWRWSCRCGFLGQYYCVAERR